MVAQPITMGSSHYFTHIAVVFFYSCGSILPETQLKMTSFTLDFLIFTTYNPYGKLHQGVSQSKYPPTMKC